MLRTRDVLIYGVGLVLGYILGCLILSDPISGDTIYNMSFVVLALALFSWLPEP